MKQTDSNPRDFFLKNYTAIRTPNFGKPFDVPSWQFPRLFDRFTFNEISERLFLNRLDTFKHHFSDGSFITFTRVQS